MSENPLLTFIRGKLKDPAKPFIIIAKIEAQPGKGDEVAQAIIESQAIPLSRKEKGCEAYDICQMTDDPERFGVHERWSSLADLEAHMQSAHFAAVIEALHGKLAAAPVFRVFSSLHETE